MNILDWQINTHYQVDHVGNRTLVIDADNPTSAATQLLAAGCPYAPPNLGWSITADDCLIRPGAPPLPPAAFAMHFGERIYIYPFGYVAVMQLNGAFTLFHLEG